MAGLSVGVSAPGWEQSIRTMRSMPAEIKREVRIRGRTVAAPLAAEIRSVGISQGSHAAGAASTVKPTVKNGVPAVVASGKPYTMGAEFGGKSPRRRATYTTISRRGNAYQIRDRRTTQQFRPFTGPDGYWFFKTMKSSRGKTLVLREWARIVDDVCRGF